VKKTEKLGASKAKAGQTIASFMQETVMLFGTMARYMRRIRTRYQPANILINCEKTPAELDAWVKEHWDFSRPASDNDYTAYDQSEDASFLQFEVIKARHHGIPPDVIADYIAIKLNVKTFRGTLAVMRLTGEGPTFDANTECNIAYNHTRFSIPPDTAQAYAGDDLAQDRIVNEKPSFAHIRDRLLLDGKPCTRSQTRGDYSDFCGWTFTPHGVIKNPLKLYASLQLGRHKGDLHKLSRSYALDATLAYNLGDRLYDVLDEDQMRFHWSSVRILLEEAHESLPAH
jgi:hypothetical protein